MSEGHGEPLNFNAKRRFDRAVDQLLGICAGIVADGEINAKEISFLSTWLADNHAVCEDFPGDQIARRIALVLADGVMTPEEHDDLLETLQQLSGNRFTDTGAAVADAPAVLSDDTAAIEFRGKRFCFTGKFAFGSRSQCENAVKALGAICDKDVTLSMNYLVLGVGVSPDWKHETYGRKIERTLEIRNSGQAKPLIVTEEQWLRAIQHGA